MVILLFICLALPLLTACSLMLFRSSLTVSTTRWVALGGALATLFVSLQLANGYLQLDKTTTPGAPKPSAATERTPWAASRARTPLPCAHCASRSFSKPIAFVSSIASRKARSASVGMVA